MSARAALAGIRRRGLPLAVLLLGGVVLGLIFAGASPTLSLATGGVLSALCLLVSMKVAQDRQSRSLSDLREQLFHCWGLLGLLAQHPTVLPPLGGFSLDARGAHALLTAVLARKPKVVVELGPGSSTVLLDLLRKTGRASFELYGVEHDEAYARSATDLMVHHEVDDWRLIYAELEHQRFGDWRGRWYSPTALEGLPQEIDFLVVDGPPGYLQPDSRYPALPALRERLGNDAWVFVDDADRRDERKIIRRWIQHDRSLHLNDDGGSFVVLSVRASG